MTIPLPLKLLGVFFVIRYLSAVLLVFGVVWIIHTLQRLT